MYILNFIFIIGDKLISIKKTKEQKKIFLEQTIPQPDFVFFSERMLSIYILLFFSLLFFFIFIYFCLSAFHLMLSKSNQGGRCWS
jgi:hypothetical protein